jgi:hypothetical protein
VIVAVFVNDVQTDLETYQVMTMLQVMPDATPVKVKILGLVVTNQVGYCSMMVISFIEGPLFSHSRI